MRKVAWRGDQQETIELLAAVARHCTCAFDARGVRYSSCPAHRMLVEDQRALDGLLFGRHVRDRFRREEWGTDPAATPGQRGSEPVAGGTGRGLSSEARDWPAYQFTPTDRSARSIDEFLAICRAMPDVASYHLQAGYFEPWLHDMGRADLASLAARLRSAELERFLRAAMGSLGEAEPRPR